MTMQLVVSPGGELRCIYGEAIDLTALGKLTIRRGSYVEPDSSGRWFADLTVNQGPVLGPFATRGLALAAEEQWLTSHWLNAAQIETSPLDKPAAGLTQLFPFPLKGT